MKERFFLPPRKPNARHGPHPRAPDADTVQQTLSLEFRHRR